MRQDCVSQDLELNFIGLNVTQSNMSQIHVSQNLIYATDRVDIFYEVH